MKVGRILIGGVFLLFPFVSVFLHIFYNIGFFVPLLPLDDYELGVDIFFNGCYFLSLICGGIIVFGR